MDKLRKIFGRAFNVENFDALVYALIMYILSGFIFGLIIKAVGHLPFVGLAAWIVGIALELYVAGGVVISILHYLKLV